MIEVEIKAKINDPKKAFEKIKHVFMTITLSKAEIKGNYLNIIKSIYKKPTANITLTSEKLNTFPLNPGRKQGCPVTTTLQHSSHSNQRRKEMNGIHIGKIEAKSHCLQMM